MFTPLDLIPYDCYLEFELSIMKTQKLSNIVSPESKKSRKGIKSNMSKQFLNFFQQSNRWSPNDFQNHIETIYDHSDRYVISSCKFPINILTLDSQTTTVEFHSHQNYSNQNNNSSNEFKNHLQLNNSSLHSLLDITISCYHDYSHLNQSYDIQPYILQPEWIHHHHPLPVDGIRCGDITISSNQQSLLKLQPSESIEAINFMKLYHSSEINQISMTGHHINEISRNLVDNFTAEDISQMTFAELKYCLEKKNVNWKKYVKAVMKKALIISMEEGKK